MQTIKDSTLIDGYTHEYRIRPVTRYSVTDYHESADGKAKGCSSLGVFDSYEAAEKVYNMMVYGGRSNKSTYLLTRKDTFDVANEVYFAQSLEQAEQQRCSLLLTDSLAQWVIAEIKE